MQANLHALDDSGKALWRRWAKCPSPEKEVGHPCSPSQLKEGVIILDESGTESSFFFFEDLNFLMFY